MQALAVGLGGVDAHAAGPYLVPLHHAVAALVKVDAIRASGDDVGKGLPGAGVEQHAILAARGQGVVVNIYGSTAYINAHPALGYCVVSRTGALAVKVHSGVAGGEGVVEHAVVVTAFDPYTFRAALEGAIVHQVAVGAVQEDPFLAGGELALTDGEVVAALETQGHGGQVVERAAIYGHVVRVAGQDRHCRVVDGQAADMPVGDVAQYDLARVRGNRGAGHVHRLVVVDRLAVHGVGCLDGLGGVGALAPGYVYGASGQGVAGEHVVLGAV